MRHPALRVTEIKFLFEIDALLVTFTVIFDKFSEKFDFFKKSYFINFLAPIAKPSSELSTLMKSIDTQLLPEMISN